MDWLMENDDDSSKSMLLKKAGEMGMDSIRRARGVGVEMEQNRRLDRAPENGLHMPRSAPVSGSGSF